MRVILIEDYKRFHASTIYYFVTQKPFLAPARKVGEILNRGQLYCDLYLQAMDADNGRLLQQHFKLAREQMANIALFLQQREPIKKHMASTFVNYEH